METKTIYTLKRNSIWLPRRNHGKDCKAYAPLISLEAQLIKKQAPGQTPRGFSISRKCEQAIYF